MTMKNVKHYTGDLPVNGYVKYGLDLKKSNNALEIQSLEDAATQNHCTKQYALNSLAIKQEPIHDKDIIGALH